MSCGYHYFIDGINFIKSVYVHLKISVTFCKGFYLTLFYGFGRSYIFIFAYGIKSFCRIVFMEHSFFHFPYIKMFLSHGKKHWYILLGYYVSLCELRSLKFSFNYSCKVVAQNMSHCIFCLYQFHSAASSIVILSPFLTVPPVFTTANIPSVGITHFPVILFTSQSL